MSCDLSSPSERPAKQELIDSGVDFSTTNSDTYPPELLECESWMGRLNDEKRPFSPWGDRDHPDADAEKDARYKWGLKENYADGETVALAEDGPRLGGRVFIQRESDPYAFIDGDDVRDPDTGEVHPGFVEILDQLGVTYADVSTSGAGAHAYYLAPDGLPIDGKGQAVFEIDTEPWGSNDSPPTVEIYANKHVCVTTGEHVLGTPLELAEWATDALRSLLLSHGFEDETTVSHDTDRDRPELEDHDPEATTAEDTTDDVRDILKAVDRLRPFDLTLSTRRTGEDSTGWSTWDPSYRSSESGESLHLTPDGDVFHDHKIGEAFGVLALFAAEEGIIREPWDRLEGAEWWEAVRAARDDGAAIPEFAPRDAEPTAVLPPSVRDLSTAASGWDWRHAGQDTDLTIQDARDRTTTAIADAYGSGDRILIEALPTMGKSYGSVKAAAETGEPVTILTGRGRKEQYDQIREWCDEFGLTYRTLPSFKYDCETGNGEHGQEWADQVDRWYRRGATPKAIHAYAEDALGRPLPCQAGEQRCTYAAKWDFDPETDGSVDPEEDEPIDVLIGHYAHGHKSKVTTGRTVVFDEFPGEAYDTTLDHHLQSAVSCWLECTEEIPFESYTDLVENRSDESRRADALLWFEEHGAEPEETHVFDDKDAHAAARVAVYVLVGGNDLGNGYEYADLGEHGSGVFNRGSGEVSILHPPDLNYSSGVVALDGTPTKRMWELTLGERLNHRPVLQPEECGEYVRDALNLNLVRTTEYIKPYNSAENIYHKEDGALLESITEKHGEAPGVVTTTTAEREYGEDVLQYVDETKHYGNVLGSNEFKTKRVGAVVGSNHYGDHYIKKWGAYAGQGVERGEGKGTDLSYSGIGGDVLTHMREHDTLQAAMRFGRDGNGAVVYVHTDTLPEWVPVAGEGRVLNIWSDGMKQVVRALEDLGRATTADLVEHPVVDLTRRRVFTHLEDLAKRGVLRRRQDPDDGRRVLWVDDGVHRVNEHGEAQLETVDLEDLTDDEVREVARSSIYTWDFRNFGADPGGDGPGARAGAVPGAGTGGDRAVRDHLGVSD